jgi:hypothetical protein
MKPNNAIQKDIIGRAVEALFYRAQDAMRTNLYGKVCVEVAFQNGKADRFTLTEEKTER